MRNQVFEVEWLITSAAFDTIGIQHFKDEGGGWPITAIDFLAHFTFLLLLLKILVIKFHVEAKGAVELAALRIVTLNRRIDDFLAYRA